MRMRSPGVWVDLYKCVALRRTDPLSCQSLRNNNNNNNNFFIKTIILLIIKTSIQNI